MEREKNERIAAVIASIRRLGRLHRMICARNLPENGLHHSQNRMLKHLYDNHGAMSQRALAEEMHITPAVVTVTLRKLEAGEYVERSTVAEDHRVMTVALTKKGRTVVEETGSAFDKIDALLFSDFTNEELDAVLAFTCRMRENLAKAGGGEKQ